VPVPVPDPPPSEPREPDLAEIDELLDQSSLGTDAARSLRNRATVAGADRILRRAKDLAPARNPGPDTKLVLQEALAALPDDQRAPILLVDVEGYSVAEAAKMLGIAEGTVKSRAARGRSKLAKTLAHLRSADVAEHHQQ
jgi:DNA-directed RNA polymerase specialized sigma24 family protein